MSLVAFIFVGFPRRPSGVSPDSVIRIDTRVLGNCDFKHARCSVLGRNACDSPTDRSGLGPLTEVRWSPVTQPILSELAIVLNEQQERKVYLQERQSISTNEATLGTRHRGFREKQGED